MTTRADERLKADVERVLESEPEVDASRIGVAVEGEVITLSGEVPSEEMRMRALRAVERVAGVRAVVDELAVRPPADRAGGDMSIARVAAHALECHTDVPPGVTAEVEDGWLTLHGRVEWEHQREAAELAVRSLPGVRGVRNLISLTPPGGAAPAVPPRALYRLRSIEHGWVAVEDTLAECERYVEGLVLQVEEAPTSRARALALSLATQLVSERWDEARERWVIDPNPTLERVRREHGLTVS
jgi:osmotically-inducible protein OsmY